MMNRISMRSTTSVTPVSLSLMPIRGAVNFYAVKEDEEVEEVMAAYQKAFPNLCSSRSPKCQRVCVAHLRYPDYLTRIQATLYGKYHLQAKGLL